MILATFQDLLDASREQPQPQRLLFTFTKIEVPETVTEEQRAAVEAGEGGNLAPILCVDKSPDEVESFTALVAESQGTGKAWDIVFVASLSGHAGVAPSSDEAAQPLRFMLEAIKYGRVAEFAAFDRNGNVLQFY
ncbi:MAG: ribonucleotide reductase subunit alpha [Rudaea sp.]